jgi:hypothetical protein
LQQSDRKICQQTKKQFFPWVKERKKIEGRHDRESAKEDLYKGLEHLVTSRGNSALRHEKSACVGDRSAERVRQNEFLRWIFNNSCTFSPDAGETAKELLRRINDAPPGNVPDLDRLLVLFTSFNNQRSTYTTGEGPIVITKSRRLVRSYEGRVDIQRLDAATSALRSWDDLVEMFSKDDKKWVYRMHLEASSTQFPRIHYPMDSLLSFFKTQFPRAASLPLWEVRYTSTILEKWCSKYLGERCDESRFRHVQTRWRTK